MRKARPRNALRHDLAVEGDSSDLAISETARRQDRMVTDGYRTTEYIVQEVRHWVLLDARTGVGYSGQLI